MIVVTDPPVGTYIIFEAMSFLSRMVDVVVESLAVCEVLVSTELLLC